MMLARYTAKPAQVAGSVTERSQGNLAIFAHKHALLCEPSLVKND